MQWFFLVTFIDDAKLISLFPRNRDTHNMDKKDQRDRHSLEIKRPSESKEYIKGHIASFPKVSPHQSRKIHRKKIWVVI